MSVKQVEKEVLVPLLCVFKNGTFLHSILLSDPEWGEEENNGDLQEEILKVGRHPDCDIVVDHPSISRWHLQIQIQKSSQELLLTDLSSVHGTFVCGQRATPKVPVRLHPDDTFKIGASTRIYKLQWLPYPSEEEEDCPTPKFLHSVYEPNKHECASDGENKEQSLTEDGYLGTAESNSWNMECGYNDENKEQASMEEGHVKSVESVLKNQECAFDGENKEQALKKERYVEDVESNSWIMECGFNDENKQALGEDGYAKSVESAICRKQECGFNDENKQALGEDGYAKSVESAICRKLTPTLSSTLFEPHKQDYGFNDENKEQASIEEGYANDVEYAPRNLSRINDGKKEQSSKLEEYGQAVESILRNLMQTPIFLEGVSENNKQDKEQVLKEHGYVEAVESVPSNPIKTPIFLEFVSEPNKQVCAFAGENMEKVLKEHGYVEAVESVPKNLVKTPIFLESVSEPNKQGYAFSGENKEHTLEEHRYVEAVESVPSNPNKTPIFLECVSEPNKQDCAFAGENKERVLKEHGYVEAVESVPCNPVKTPIFLESVSEPNKQGCAFSGENKEQALEEHRYVEAVESVPCNPIKTPIFLECVSEPNKQDFAFAGENQEQALKEHGYVEVELVYSNLTPILSGNILETNKQECGFDEENKEQAPMEEGLVKVVESDPRNRTPKVSGQASKETTMNFGRVNQENSRVNNKPSNKRECGFVDKSKEHFLMEGEYVEPVESIPWKPVQPSAPPLPESPPPQQNSFAVVADAEMTPLQENQSPMREKNAGKEASNLWSRRQKDGNLVCLQTGHMEIILNPKKMKGNPVKLTKQKRILKENSSSEMILKDNHVRCDRKNRGLDEKKKILQVLQPETSAHGSSSTGFYQEENEFYPSDKENWTPKVSSQASKATTKNFARVDQEIHPKTDTRRAPFQSLSQNSRVNKKPPISSSLKNTNKSMDNHQGLHSEVQVLGRVQPPTPVDSKKKWHMVVDTDCLVHEESRQALKQLEGIKGTRLIIPRIVIRELDCLKRQNKSKKGKKSQEIFRWIEECMVNKSWWIHVQNSTECFSVGVTPPASPHSNLSDGSNDASASVAFSSYGSFADVLSPTAEDHILECALLYKQLATGGRVVLLSNDVALKIKAMAEGMLCENAKEFCQSLVSPYSERFLWSQSTAHGHNWTDINNSNSRKSLGMMTKSTYFGMMRKSLLCDEESKKKSNEGAKGLKLILLHNSHYGQKHIEKK